MKPTLLWLLLAPLSPGQVTDRIETGPPTSVIERARQHIRDYDRGRRRRHEHNLRRGRPPVLLSDPTLPPTTVIPRGRLTVKLHRLADRKQQLAQRQGGAVAAATEVVFQVFDVKSVSQVEIPPEVAGHFEIELLLRTVPAPSSGTAYRQLEKKPHLRKFTWQAQLNPDVFRDRDLLCILVARSKRDDTPYVLDAKVFRPIVSEPSTALLQTAGRP